jgi:hypothetical protein
MTTTVHLSAAPAVRTKGRGFWLARRVGFEPPQPGPVQVRAGRSPVWLAIAPSAGPAGSSRANASTGAAVRLQVLSHAGALAAGVPGVLIRLTRVNDAAATRRVELSLDYSRFRDAYGGNWADRLQLVELTGCTSVIPAPAGCRLKPIAFRNDLANERLDTTVPVSAPALASAAMPSPALRRNGPWASLSAGTAVASSPDATFVAAMSSPS